MSWKIFIHARYLLRLKQLHSRLYKH
jgi:hypothetical protein